LGITEERGDGLPVSTCRYLLACVSAVCSSCHLPRVLGLRRQVVFPISQRLSFSVGLLALPLLCRGCYSRVSAENPNHCVGGVGC